MSVSLEASLNRQHTILPTIVGIKAKMINGLVKEKLSINSKVSNTFDK